MLPRRRHVAGILERTGLMEASLRRGRGWRGVLVLAYHRVVDEFSPRCFDGVWSAEPLGFGTQLDLLAEYCDVVPLDDVPRFHGTRGRRVAITVDDCYVDSYDTIFPALLARGFPATFFLPSGIIDRRVVAFWDQVAWLAGGLADGGESIEDAVAAYGALPAPERQSAFLEALAARSSRDPLTPADVSSDWMTWAMAREMVAAGMAIGGHTDGHPILSRLSADEQRREIVTGLDRIEQELGERPRAFAYPVGGPWAFNGATRSIVRELGLVGYSIYGRPLGGGAWNPADARRVAIGEGVDLRALVGLPGAFGLPWPPPALVRWVNARRQPVI